jgi:hypothetical protein
VSGPSAALRQWSGVRNPAGRIIGSTASRCELRCPIALWLSLAAEKEPRRSSTALKKSSPASKLRKFG